MAVRASIKRVILKGVYRSALSNSITLREALDSAFDARYEAIENGRMIAGTSGSGYSVQFSVPTRGFSPLSVTEALSELDDLYECAVNHATEATDESRMDWMLSKLRDPQKIEHSFRNIRI